jgi:copper chaperone CopZ
MFVFSARRDWGAPPAVFPRGPPLGATFRKPQSKEETAMESDTFSIPNISCGHCTRSIENELTGIAGVKSVTGDPQAKTVTIAWEAPATRAKILQTLREINYPAAE